jgi:hypothetical protein
VTAIANAMRNAHDAEWTAACAAFRGPLFESLRGELESLTEFPDIAALNRLAALGSPPPLTADGRRFIFVAPEPSRKGLSAVDSRYEARVQLEAAIETRPGNWHDMFNALVWLAWPLAKAALNAVHSREMKQENSVRTGRRSVARDVATLFDEGGAVLACADPGLADLLRQFRWQELFCVRRAEVESRIRCYIFGHALFDRARQPYKGMTAHALIFAVTTEFFLQTPALQVRALDAMLADWFDAAANLDSTQRLAPLPVLGFPGFCAASTDPRYYDDAAVFRPGRMRKQRP